MMSLTERIRRLRRLREQKNLAVREEYNNTRPMMQDLRKIGYIHEVFKGISDPGCRDNTKIFVLLAFYMYDPASLLNKRICRGSVRREIGKALGLSNSAITKHFADAKSLLLNHKGFRDEAERLYEGILQSLGIQG